MPLYHQPAAGLSKFYTRLIFEDRGGYPFRMMKPLVYYSNLLADYIIVPHPPQFLTDLASIPWICQWLLPRIGGWDRAAVIHDYLYSTQTLPRSLCDAILREAMQADGVNWRRWLIWAGVRLGGWYAWRSDGKLLA